MLFTGRKSQRDMIVRNGDKKSITSKSSKPSTIHKKSNRVAPFSSTGKSIHEYGESPVNMDTVDVGLMGTMQPDEFGQVPDHHKNVEDFGRLRSLLNSVSDYSKISKDPSDPSLLYEGQGSSKQLDSEYESNEVQLPCIKPIFKQFIKRGYYNFVKECIETTSRSQDTTALDISELLSELSPKINDIKQLTEGSIVDHEKVLLEKKQMKIHKKSVQIQRALMYDPANKLTEMQILELEKKVSSRINEVDK